MRLGYTSGTRGNSKSRVTAHHIQRRNGPLTWAFIHGHDQPTRRMPSMSGLLAAERRRRRTRRRRRALGCYRKAVLVLRWFCDGTRLAQLAADNRIGRSTAYRCLHEGIDALAAAAPGLRPVGRPRRRASARHRGRHADSHRPLPRTGPDGAGRPPAAPGGPVVVGQSTPATAATCRSSPRPMAGRSGPRTRGPAASTTPPHCAPTPRPCRYWPSGPTRPMRGPGRPGLRGRTRNADHADQAPHRWPAQRRSAHRQLVARGTRGPAERGNSLLKTTFKALRRVSLCP
jgi:hypothetical protein